MRRAVNTPDRNGPLRALAGRHGAEHPGRLRRRASPQACSGRWPAPSASSARARAASGSRTGRWCTSCGRCGRGSAQDNQLGREFPPLTYTQADADGLIAARAGAAHRPRRARSAQRRPAVRQRVRAGLPGRGAQAGGLLRQRRRALPDGGHGDRRDPSQHPLGVAAQGRAAHRRRPDDRRPGRRSRSTRRCSRGCSPRSTRSCSRAGNRDVHDDSKTTTLPIAREIVDDLCHRSTSSCRGTSTC